MQIHWLNEVKKKKRRRRRMTRKSGKHLFLYRYSNVIFEDIFKVLFKIYFTLFFFLVKKKNQIGHALASKSAICLEYSSFVDACNQAPDGLASKNKLHFHMEERFVVIQHQKYQIISIYLQKRITSIAHILKTDSIRKWCDKRNN